MFLKLNHQNLKAYSFSKKFVIECYKLAKHFPPDEKFGMITQIKRASLSVHLNIAEGSLRKSSVERNRYYEIARGSLVEVDAALDVAKELNYLDNFELQQLEENMVRTFKTLSGMITQRTNNSI